MKKISNIKNILLLLVFIINSSESAVAESKKNNLIKKALAFCCLIVRFYYTILYLPMSIVPTKYRRDFLAVWVYNGLKETNLRRISGANR